jgi:hypothetical protein
MMNKIDLFKVKLAEDYKGFKRAFPHYSGGMGREEQRG